MNDKKILKPTSNIVQISSRRDAKFYIFLTKIFFQTFEEVELHALGDAITLSTRVAENLSRYGFTEIVGTEIFTYVPEEDQEGKRRGKRVKMVVKLRKSS